MVRMLYIRMFLMWLGVIAIMSIFGEYIVSREVNGYLQLLCFIGVVGIFGYVFNETINLFKKEKK